MFSTFRSTINKPDSASAKVTKTKRSQVSRACDACRLSRLKCDSTRPCRKCQESGRECVDGSNEFRGLAAAVREVDQLRRKVKELEKAQANANSSSASASPVRSEEGFSKSGPWVWKGVSIDGVCYGPTAMPYFINRLSKYLQQDVRPPAPPSSFLAMSLDDFTCCDTLGRPQQDQFLDLFWPGYHLNVPVVDQEGFRGLYESLWISDTLRRSDPLVDIVLALCIQYAYLFMPQDQSAERPPVEHPASAGGPFFQRCQMALQEALERPSIKVVQCTVLTSLYLQCASSYNAAHTELRKAESILSAVAAVDEGSADKSPEAKLLRRIQRSIRTMDIRLRIKLGRLERCPRPAIPPDAKDVPFDEFSPDWFAFHEHMLALCEVGENVFVSFMDQCNDVLRNSNQTDLYSNASVRDECARLMKRQMAKLRQWATQVPAPLRVRGQLYGTASFSTMRSALSFSDADPHWLQRQRIILECQYHDICVSLQRIFLDFSPNPTFGTLNSDQSCICCVNHAVRLAGIIEQANQETDLLVGCYQAGEWAQNALYALAGFCVGYPVSPPAPNARKALAVAGRIFASYGGNNDTMAGMNRLAQEFDEMISGIVSKFRVGSGSASTVTQTPDTPPVTTGLSTTIQELETVLPQFLAESPAPAVIPFPFESTASDSLLWTGQSPEGQDLWNAWMTEY